MDLALRWAHVNVMKFNNANYMVLDVDWGQFPISVESECLMD